MTIATGSLIDTLVGLVADVEGRGFKADVIGALADVAKDTSLSEVIAERNALAELYEGNT